MVIRMMPVRYIWTEIETVVEFICYGLDWVAPVVNEERPYRVRFVSHSQHRSMS